ncbi:MAG: hypothetical protein AAGH15_14290 [Myxococcota bacterium]
MSRLGPPALVLLLLGCAGPAAERGASRGAPTNTADDPAGDEAARAAPAAEAVDVSLPFPTVDRVQALVAEAGPIEAFAQDRAYVPFPWQLAEMPESPRRAPHERASFAGAILADLLASEGEVPLPEVEATEGMRCVASAEARVFLSEGKPPAPAYEEFAMARCGVPADGVRAAGIGFDLPPGGRLTSLAPGDRARVVSRLRAVLVDLGPGEVGAALASSAGKAFLALAHAVPRVRTQTPRPLARRTGEVEVAGEVLGSTPNWIGGTINRGDQGYAACEVDPGIPLPRFRMRCQLAPGDPLARISLTIGEGALLAQRLANFVGRRPDVDARGPVAARGEPGPIARAADLAELTIEAFNDVRAEAGFPALTLSREESARLDGLVRAAVDPRFGGAAGDELSLAIVAGSAITGAPPLRDGGYVGSMLLGPPDAAAWLTTCFLDPDIRRLFLDPAARVAAIGAEVTPRGMAALTATWQTHGDALTEAAAGDAILSAIQRARLGRGLPGAQPLRGYDGLGRALRRVQVGEATRQEALDAVLAEAAEAVGGAVEAFSIQTLDLRGLEVPEPLLTPGPLEVQVAVAHRRAPRSTWGVYLVGVVVRRAPGEVL